MRKARFTEHQIIAVLKSVEAGRTVKDVCREAGISEASYYNWKAKYGGMEASVVDKATPAIMRYVSNGKHISKLEVSVCKAGGSQIEYCRITLEDVLITNVMFNGVTQRDFIGISYQFLCQPLYLLLQLPALLFAAPAFFVTHGFIFEHQRDGLFQLYQLSARLFQRIRCEIFLCIFTM